MDQKIWPYARPELLSYHQFNIETAVYDHIGASI